MITLDDATIDELFGVLSRYVRIRERAANTTLRTVDGAVESAAYKCLFHLAGQSMRSGHLAEFMVADPSTVSRHVATLVDLGYVRREADPADGRATLLVATDAGVARAEQIRAHRRTRLHALLDGWSEDELDTLVALLTRFVDAAGQWVAPACGDANSAAINEVKKDVRHDK